MSDAAQQWGVLGFNKDGQLALPGFPEGFSNGLTLQAWVLPRNVGGRWQLLELGGGRERGALVLGAGDAPGSLELRMEDPQGRASLSAPGVLVEGRWSHISATIDAQGMAVLYVQGVQAARGLLRPPGALEWSSGFVGRSEREQGLDGELSQLSIWRRVLEPETVASQWRGTLRGDEPGLAACYLLGSVVEGQVLDVSPSQRHAWVRGTVEPRSSTALAEAMADVPLAARFPGSGGSLQLPPLTPEVLQEGLSFQAWIRPRRADSTAYLLELGAGSGKDSLILRGEKGSDALIIEERFRTVVTKGGTIPQVDVKMQTTTVCKVPGVLVPDRWVHVSAVLDAKQKQCTVYVNGREAYQGTMAVRFFGSKEVRTHCYVGRSSRDASATFAGDLAELRLWRRPLSAEHVAKTWLSRLRGDEKELLGCYRLDTLEKGLAIDVSFRRMHARVWTPVTAVPAEALPLRSVIRGGQAGAGVQGRLLTDWVPLSAFPKDRKLEEANAVLDAVEHLPGMDSRSIQGSLVRCSVYEVVIEPRNAAGEPVAQGQAELSFDQRVEVLRTENGQVWIESWPARASRKLVVPDTARLRLREDPQCRHLWPHGRGGHQRGHLHRPRPRELRPAHTAREATRARRHSGSVARTACTPPPARCPSCPPP